MKALLIMCMCACLLSSQKDTTDRQFRSSSMRAYKSIDDLSTLMNRALSDNYRLSFTVDSLSYKMDSLSRSQRRLSEAMINYTNKFRREADEVNRVNNIINYIGLIAPILTIGINIFVLRKIRGLRKLSIS